MAKNNSYESRLKRSTEVSNGSLEPVNITLKIFDGKPIAHFLQGKFSFSNRRNRISLYLDEVENIGDKMQSILNQEKFSVTLRAPGETRKTGIYALMSTDEEGNGSGVDIVVGGENDGYTHPLARISFSTVGVFAMVITEGPWIEAEMRRLAMCPPKTVNVVGRNSGVKRNKQQQPAAAGMGGVCKPKPATSGNRKESGKKAIKMDRSPPAPYFDQVQSVNYYQAPAEKERQSPRSSGDQGGWLPPSSQPRPDSMLTQPSSSQSFIPRSDSEENLVGFDTFQESQPLPIDFTLLTPY